MSLVCVKFYYPGLVLAKQMLLQPPPSPTSRARSLGQEGKGEGDWGGRGLLAQQCLFSVTNVGERNFAAAADAAKRREGRMGGHNCVSGWDIRRENGRGSKLG